MVPRDKRTMGGGAAVLLVVILPLWRELHEPGQMVWNVVLAVILAGLAVATFFIHQYLHDHISEVGEARFDTTNKSKNG